MNSSIVLTGGGSAGHVTPNLALIELLEPKGWRIDYIGSYQGIERDMIEREGIPYHAISTGKLRRTLTTKNLMTPFQVIKGIWEAFHHLRRIRPKVVFSKGGFVAFPVVLSAWCLGIPVVAHESDLTPGLANRLSFPFVTKLCVAFPVALQGFRSQKKLLVTGSAIRASLMAGDAARAFSRCGFTQEKPVLLVVGGSLGAQKLNQSIREILPQLLEKFHVIHLCGKGKVDASYEQVGYFQCEYAHSDMADFMAASCLVVSRAGANALYELLALGKPHILIPLSTQASRGDQVENAKYFAEQGVSLVIDDRQLSGAGLLAKINDAYENLASFEQKIKALGIRSGTEKLLEVLEATQRL